MSDTTTIRFAPPLPCSALLAIGRRCNTPATVAQATRLGDGTYHLQPFCRSCVAGMARVYGVAGPSETNEESHE